MTTLSKAVEQVLLAQKVSQKRLAVILAGHNGSGKSTLWYDKGLADHLQIPLINADRMMMSILPEPFESKAGERLLPPWAAKLRDENQSWMNVAQKGVEAFVAQAMAHGVPFAMETVFSHWQRLPDGTIESKIDRIREMQKSDYFVLLIFVGLANSQLSIARVHTRIASGGHAVDEKKLLARFPRTQKAISRATDVADASILVDNSGNLDEAFTVCRVQVGNNEVYDSRAFRGRTTQAAHRWMDIVTPRT